MPVWFAYRCFDFKPTGKYLRRFEDDTVLGWFQRHWDHLAVEDHEEADSRLAGVLGCDGWYLPGVFVRAAEAGLSPPQTWQELSALIRARFPGDDTLSASPHVLQILNEDDGEGGGNYFFDGHFLEESPGLAAYLLHEDWRLPSGHGDGPYAPSASTMPIEPGGDGPGVTYLAMLTRESKYSLDDLPVGHRIEGVRLPDLARHLCAAADEDWHGAFRTLPALMLAGVEMPDPMEDAFLRAIRAAPGDAVNWAAWADWRLERGGEPPGVTLLRDAFARLARLPGRLQDDLPRDADLAHACRELLGLEARHQGKSRASPSSLIHVEGHLAQMCLDVSHDDDPYFGQWIFFDDLWAGAHPALADAILRFAARWDVLTAE